MTLAAEYHDVQVRWPDLDGLGHLNHSAVLVYLEVGRDEILRRKGISAADFVIRHCSVDYESEVRPIGPSIQYRCDGLDVGTTSIRVTEALLNDEGNPAVSAVFTLVMWDRVNRTSRAVTDEERKTLAGFEGNA